MVKLREMLKGTIFENRINLLIEDAQNKWLRDLGKNGFIHSNNVENNLDMLVPDQIKINEKVFDKAEIFLLLYAVYLHDIGRCSDEIHHEKETYNKILNNPEKYGLKNKFEANAIAEICYGHAKESEKPIQSIRSDYGIAGLSNKPLNLQFLASLLRLADELDNAYTRVQGIKGQDNNIRNLIRFIKFDHFRWIIELQSEPSTWKDWMELKKIRDYTQTRLDEIKDILELKGLLYYQIWVDPKDFSKLQKPLPKDIEQEELKKFVGNLVSDEADYDRKYYCYPIDIYFEEKVKGRIYKNAVFINKEIDADMIYGYKEEFKRLKSSDEIDHGFVVAEKITEGIYNLAKAEKIEIITVQDLIENSTNFFNYLKNCINTYEISSIFKKDCYIPLTAVLETKENIGIIDDYLDKWLISKRQLQITILGDYGAGKSTIAKRLLYRQAKRYLSNPANERIPILIELKKYQKSISIESLITDLLINEYHIEIKNFKTFKHLNESGRLLLILDGFDEMASRVDYETTLANFRQFDKLISDNSKMILTCRTHYFKNQDEIHKLHRGTEIYQKIDKSYSFCWDKILENDNSGLVEFLKQISGVDLTKTAKIEKIDDSTIRVSTEKNSILLKLNNEKTKIKLEIDDGRSTEFTAKIENGDLKIYDKKGGYTFVFLNPLKEEDLVKYLKKIFDRDWEEFYQMILDTYNLHELAEKPILLELMAETLPQIKTDNNQKQKIGKLNHASLYDRYTKFWLERDDWRSYLTSNEREIITEELAFYLFKNKKDKIFYGDLPELIKQQLPPDKRTFELEYLDQDIRTCTFLNRDEHGNYSFIHKSFLEFFVAKKLANENKNINSVSFTIGELSPEILNFYWNLIDVHSFYSY